MRIGLRPAIRAQGPGWGLTARRRAGVSGVWAEKRGLVGAELLVGEITAVMQVGQALEIGDSRALLAAVRGGRTGSRERRDGRVPARRQPAADRARGVAELRIGKFPRGHPAQGLDAEHEHDRDADDRERLTRRGERSPDDQQQKRERGGGVDVLGVLAQRWAPSRGAAANAGRVDPAIQAAITITAP